MQPGPLSLPIPKLFRTGWPRSAAHFPTARPISGIKASGWPVPLPRRFRTRQRPSAVHCRTVRPISRTGDSDGQLGGHDRPRHCVQHNICRSQGGRHHRRCRAGCCKCSARHGIRSHRQAAASQGFDAAKNAVGEVYDEATLQVDAEVLTPDGIGKAA
jgi:hypothetical protein